MNTRLLGALGMLGGAGLLAVEARHLISGAVLSGASIDTVDELGYLAWGIGGTCAFWAMYQLGATGKGRLTRLVPLIAVIGFAAMALGSAIDALGMANPRTNPIFFVAWPLVGIGTLLAAIFALIARTWTGWRKVAPLLPILAIPVFVVLGPLTGRMTDLLFGLAWIVLGYAVFSSDETAAQLVPATA